VRIQELSHEGIVPRLGHQLKTGNPVELTDEARRQGVYIVGTTGTGKTTLLQNIVYQDMLAGDGLCVLDPHGDFIDELLLRVPAARRDEVILFAPGDPDQFEQPLGLNLLECQRDDPRQVRRVVSTVIDTLYKLFAYSWGPRMEDLLRNAILTLMEKPDTTLLDLWLLLASPDHRQQYTSGLSDPYLQQYWDVQFAGYAKNQRDLVELVGSSLNKIGRFLADPLIRNIVAQPRSAFNLRQIMDEGKILLVNLSKGDLGEDNAALLGAVLVNLVLIAALQRREIAPRHRRRFHLIVDEYQSFATESFPTLQSEARKYGIDVMVAHQYRDQLDELNQGSTLNVANFIMMRVSGRDSLELASQFDNTPPPAEVRKEPLYVPYEDGSGRDLNIYTQYKADYSGESYYQEVEQPRRAYNDVQAETANQLSTLPNREAMCRLVEDNRLREYRVVTEPPAGQPNPDGRSYIRRQSLARGRAKGEVEAAIRHLIGSELVFDAIPEAEADR
jgi:hypothetical protein